MLLVQVPTSSNIEDTLNFAPELAVSHHLLILWLQSTSLVWHHRYLYFQILPHQFRINAPCLVDLYLLPNLHTKGYAQKVLKNVGTWPRSGSPGSYTALSLSSSAVPQQVANNKLWQNNILSPQPPSHNLLKYKSY